MIQLARALDLVAPPRRSGAGRAQVIPVRRLNRARSNHERGNPRHGTAAGLREKLHGWTLRGAADTARGQKMRVNEGMPTRSRVVGRPGSAARIGDI